MPTKRVRISPPKSARHLIPVESKDTKIYVWNTLFLHVRVPTVQKRKLLTLVCNLYSRISSWNDTINDWNQWNELRKKCQVTQATGFSSRTVIHQTSGKLVRVGVVEGVAILQKKIQIHGVNFIFLDWIILKSSLRNNKYLMWWFYKEAWYSDTKMELVQGALNLVPRAFPFWIGRPNSKGKSPGNEVEGPCHGFLACLWMSVWMGLTVSRQTAKNLTVNRQKWGNLLSTVKKAGIVSRKTVSRSCKSHYFSCSSRTVGSQRIVLTGTTSLHVPKNTHFTVFSTHLRLNWHFNWLPSGSISGFKILLINCIDRNKEVNVNFNSWKKCHLDNRQPSN